MALIERGVARGELPAGVRIARNKGDAEARIEGQIAYETLFRRFPDLRLAVPAAGLWVLGCSAG